MKTTIAVTGTNGYSGRYIALEAERRGYAVIGLTNTPAGAATMGAPPRPTAPLNWEDEEALAESMRGCRALVNTYWVRFDHGAFSHERAIANTKVLFRAARRAGVERIVHTSITHPDATSPLPYFRGKALLEQELATLGLPYAILRPAVLFGPSPAESILINNMAWALRHLPVIGVPGDGNYRLQPIHVEEFAALAVDAAEDDAPSCILEAIEPETFPFRALFRRMGELLGRSRPVLPMPPALVRTAAGVLGLFQRDVLLTHDEIRGLMEDRLAVDGAPAAGKRRLTEWIAAHASELGRRYASELARRR